MKTSAKVQLAWKNPKKPEVDEDDDPITTLYLSKTISTENEEGLYETLMDEFDHKVDFGMLGDGVNVYSTDPKIVKTAKEVIDDHLLYLKVKVKEVAGPVRPDLKLAKFKTKVKGKYTLAA